MKTIIAAAYLFALVGVSSSAQAGVTRDRSAPAAEAAPGRTNQTAPAGHPATQAADYAAREAATPELARFQGGNGIYIGGGIVTVLLIVLLVVIIL